MPPASRHSRARTRARTRASASTYRRRRTAAVAAIVVLLGTGIALFALSGSSRPAAAGKTNAGSHHHRGRHGPPRCPLTDLRAPGGQVPSRPALAVKVGNEPEGARPQSGLDDADIVYDTPAEGGIMRYVAVFQCESAASIGPTRSVRWVDWHILQSFGKPILAFAGGINPDVDTVEGLGWLKPADLLTGAAGAGTRITSRQPPDNLYTSTAQLWALYPSDTTPPPAVFRYSSSVPSGGDPTSRVEINYSQGTDVVWQWNATTKLWDHAYADSTGASEPDIGADGVAISTTNVVIQIVHVTYGPYAESPGSTGDVESQTVGSGSGYVLRDGVEIPVSWHRASLSAPTTFADAGGQHVALRPGRTFVELVPTFTESGISFTH